MPPLVHLLCPSAPLSLCPLAPLPPSRAAHAKDDLSVARDEVAILDRLAVRGRADDLVRRYVIVIRQAIRAFFVDLFEL